MRLTDTTISSTARFDGAPLVPGAGDGGNGPDPASNLLVDIMMSSQTVYVSRCRINCWTCPCQVDTALISGLPVRAKGALNKDPPSPLLVLANENVFVTGSEN